MVSDDLKALVANCRENPTDDLPRLVLADWLEDHDDPARAELIRIQCELTRGRVEATREEMLQQRECELLAEHKSAWSGGIMERLNIPCSFERGLLHLTPQYAELDKPEFLEWMESNAGGMLETVAPNHIPMYPASEHPYHLSRLCPKELHPTLSLEWVLACSEYREQPASEIVTGWEAIACGPNWPWIRRLRVTQSVPLVLNFLSALDFRHITHMHIQHPSSYLTLCEKRFDALRELQIDVFAISSQRFMQLANQADAKQLQVLYLSGVRVYDEGINALLKTPWVETLTTLEVVNTQIGDVGIKALVKSGLLGRLRQKTLNLSMNPLGKESAIALAECPDMSWYAELVLRECFVGNAGAEALAASPYLANLTYLDLWRNRIGTSGAKALAASPYLNNIRDLNLRENDIGEKGKQALLARFGSAAKV